MNFSGNKIHHCPFYCEENIWHLCQEDFLTHYDRKVVFISNQNRCFAMNNQRGVSPDSLISWDYHVVLMFNHNNEWKVADLDSLLFLPCSVQEYLSDSFVPDLFTCAPPVFRVVDADYFIRYFSSDRRHMRNQDGLYLKTPPTFPPIQSESGEDFNLWDFVDTDKTAHGQIYTLREMYTEFL